MKKQYKALIVSLLVIAAGYLPFFIWGNTGPAAVFAGFGTYTQDWANNGFIFNLIEGLSSVFINNSYIFSKILCGIIFLIIWTFIYLKKHDLPEKMFLTVTVIFLLSPVGDPWYFCWVIPFLCIYRRFSLIALSGLLILHYFIFTRDFGAVNIGSFKIENLLLMQYVPFYLYFLFEQHFNNSSCNKMNPEQAKQS